MKKMKMMSSPFQDFILYFLRVLKWIFFYSRLSYIAAFMFFNPLTPMSDQDRISLYTINTKLTR